MNRQEFLRLYDELRPESLEKLDEISQYVFGAFDKDNSGFYNKIITFDRIIHIKFHVQVQYHFLNSWLHLL